MSVAIITGSAGLIGSEASRHFAAQGLDVVGIDNDSRRQFFGDAASTRWQRHRPEKNSALATATSTPTFAILKLSTPSFAVTDRKSRW